MLEMSASFVRRARPVGVRFWVAVCAAFVLFLAAASAAHAAVNATEGQQFSGVVVTVPCINSMNSNGKPISNCSPVPTASISWGDGTASSTATVTKVSCSSAASGSCLEFSGTHTYAQPTPTNEPYSGLVSFSSTTESGTDNFQATVSDAALTLAAPTIGRTGNDATMSASLHDADTQHLSCNYTATIDWGDGTTTQGAVRPASGVVEPGCDSNNPGVRQAHARGALIGGSQPGSFTVSGTHTYASASDPSSDEATVTVTDSADGQMVSQNAPVPYPAAATTLPASSVGPTSAMLNASVNLAGGQLVSCNFTWGPTAGGTEPNQAPCTGLDATNTNAPQSVTAALTGLTANTGYSFRVVLVTNVGTTQGDDESFTTLPPAQVGAPTAITGAADGLATTAATLHGQVDPGNGTIADCHFEWGTTTSYGNMAPCSPSTGAVAAALTGLSADTVYHFRVVATNANSPTTDGADATFTTLPDCGVEVKFGYVDGTGCLGHQGEPYVSTPGSTVQLNGLTLVPGGTTTFITIDPAKSQIKSDGPVDVYAGPVHIYSGTFTWTVPPGGGGAPVHVADLPLFAHSVVEGLQLFGNFSLAFNPQMGADLTGSVGLPFGALAKALGLQGSVTLHTAPGVGLKTDQLSITAPTFELDGVGVKNLSVSYSPSADIWMGGAEIDLPTPNKVGISASLAFQHGSFKSFSGSALNLGVPLFAGVDLQKISVMIGVDPFSFGGGLGISFGPQVKGEALAGADGNFSYSEPAQHVDGFIKVNGSLTLASFKIANAYFNYDTTSGLTQFGGNFQLGLPNSNTSNPQKQPVYIGAGLNGALEGSKFDLDAKVQVDLNFIDTDVGAEVLVSDKGLVGCATLSVAGFSWSPGFGYMWSTGDLDLMWKGCSVGPYQTLPLGGASASALGREVKLVQGSSLLQLTGTTGAPKVTLRGPRGQRVSVPLNSVAPVEGAKFTVLQDPTDKTTWIAIRHSGGRWRVIPEAGSSTLASVKDAPLLPTPGGTGSVTGRGAKKTLKWKLHALSGDSVAFWEKGPGVDRLIATTRKARGTLHFTPAAGRGGRRRIEAQVLYQGLARKELAIASYKVPATPPPAIPGALKVGKASGGRVKVTWTKSARAQQYMVTAKTADGEHLTQLLPGNARSVTLKAAVPITAASVQVTGQLANGLSGQPAKATYPAPAKHKKKPAKHKKKPAKGKAKKHAKG